MQMAPYLPYPPSFMASDARVSLTAENQTSEKSSRCSLSLSFSPRLCSDVTELNLEQVTANVSPVGGPVFLHQTHHGLPGVPTSYA